MSSPIDLPHALDPITRLKSAAESFAEREEKLVREYRSKLLAIKRDEETALDQLEQKRQAKRDAAEARAGAAAERSREIYEGRKARLPRAYHSSRQRLQGKADAVKGGRVGKAQSELILANQARDEKLAKAGHEHAEFTALLDENREEYKRLRARARKAFGGYGSFLAKLSGKGLGDAAEPNLAKPEDQLRWDAEKALGEAKEAIAAFKGLLLPKVFRAFPLWLMFVVIVIIHGVFLVATHFEPSQYPLIGGTFAGSCLVVFAIYFMGMAGSGGAANRVAAALESARKLCLAAGEKADQRLGGLQESLNKEQKEQSGSLSGEWKDAAQAAAKVMADGEKKLNAQQARIPGKLDALYAKWVGDNAEARDAAIAAIDGEAKARLDELNAAYAKQRESLERDHAAAWESLEQDWKAETEPAYAALESLRGECAARFPEWTPEFCARWSPPHGPADGARFGGIEASVSKLAARMPESERLALPGPDDLAAPLCLTFPRHGSLLIETDTPEKSPATAALNAIMLRLLAANPAGKLKFTIVDPVGLGESFAGIMHLADFEDGVINGRIWTQPAQIEEKLADLNDHIEKVIQMYLRNEFETIAEYNEQAGNIAEKYHFLIIADFPNNFSETAIKRLLSIVQSGPRCGIFPLIHWDRRQSLALHVDDADLRGSAIVVRQAKAGGFELLGGPGKAARVAFDQPPADALMTDFIQKVGKAGIDSNRVEVPFEHVAPPESDLWEHETTNELRVPIGRTGAKKLQELAIGKGTRQHALIAGKTGSGKSTLFHVMITNLALWYSPDQVEFFLVDFKKGVEFKCYAAKKLPHARVVAIESDREFGLSVLQKVDDELRRRGDLFRQVGAQDVAGYKRAGGGEAMPRCLLMIDEFQEFFTEDDRVAQNASLLLDRIVRQGRAFGIHVILGSQTLGGAYTLARATLGQMVIRIALQCNEADAYLIMDDDNPAPRLLTRPGEGIYNDNAGAVDGNSPFQTVWISEEDRDKQLDRVRALAEQRGLTYKAPIVFEGNAPAEIRENTTLAKALAGPRPASIPPVGRAWLGAPNSIKGPTEAAFQRQSGSHLLIVGQRDESALAMFGASLASLAAQYPQDGARFFVFDASPPGTPERDWLESVVNALPQDAQFATNAELSETMEALAAELAARGESPAPGAPEIFVFIRGVQKFKKLRQEEDFSFSFDDDASSGGANAGKIFNDLISEGPAAGIHIIAAADSYNNVNRWINRKALSEFEMRVLFQMSANDSSSLIDSPAAANLGLHRAVYHNEHEGYQETFRPYALPGAAWVEEIKTKLA